MEQPVVPTRNPNDIDTFLNLFEEAAGDFSWFLVDGWKIRTKIDGMVCCPLMAYGYARSGSHKTVPSVRDFGTSCGLRDRQIVVIIHHADDMSKSPHYRPEVRERLLKACNLFKEPEPTTEEEEAPTCIPQHSVN